MSRCSSGIWVNARRTVALSSDRTASSVASPNNVSGCAAASVTMRSRDPKERSLSRARLRAIVTNQEDPPARFVVILCLAPDLQKCFLQNIFRFGAVIQYTHDQAQEEIEKKSVIK